MTSTKRAKTTDGGNVAVEPPRCFEMVSRDKALMDEFCQESETVFCQDDTCYEHYKEMQRDAK